MACSDFRGVLGRNVLCLDLAFTVMPLCQFSCKIACSNNHTYGSDRSVLGQATEPQVASDGHV